MIWLRFFYRKQLRIKINLIYEYYYKGDYPVSKQEYYLCKKSAILSGQTFYKNKEYKVMEIQQGPTIVLNHIYFYCGPTVYPPDSRPYIYDYFYNQIEERKFKIKKINES